MSIARLEQKVGLDGTRLDPLVALNKDRADRAFELVFLRQSGREEHWLENGAEAEGGNERNTAKRRQAEKLVFHGQSVPGWKHIPADPKTGIAGLSGVHIPPGLAWFCRRCARLWQRATIWLCAPSALAERQGYRGAAAAFGAIGKLDMTIMREDDVAGNVKTEPMAAGCGIP